MKLWLFSFLFLLVGGCSFPFTTALNAELSTIGTYEFTTTTSAKEGVTTSVEKGRYWWGAPTAFLAGSVFECVTLSMDAVFGVFFEFPLAVYSWFKGPYTMTVGPLDIKPRDPVVLPNDTLNQTK